MFSKKIRLGTGGKSVSVATALVLMAIEEIFEDKVTKEVYGYQIMTHLRESYNWNVKSGTVYPILKKLDRDLLIRKGVVQDRNNATKRQMIFYRITRKGRILVDKIKNLNDNALETALSSNDSGILGDRGKNKEMKAVFPSEDFNENYLAPFLIDFDNQIASQISLQSSIEEMDNLTKEIKKSIDQLEICKALLKGQISRIENLKKIKK
jgi:DNA-binding PadR family transcriptional regulator